MIFVRLSRAQSPHQKHVATQIKTRPRDLTTGREALTIFIALLSARRSEGSIVNYAFNRMFTLAEIAERAALPIERLRYVIDSRILPGRRHLKPGAGASSPGRGIPRRLPRTKRLVWLW